MAKKIRSFDEIRLDIVEAVKRSYIHRGFIPRAPRLDKQEGSKDGSKEKDTKEASKSEEPEPEESPAEAQAPEPQEAHEKLIDITIKAHDVLFKADTVFPFTLFPDTVTLDREKLTVATRTFFRVAKIISVPVSSILSAEVDVGPFFGSIHLTSKFFVRNAYSVRFLWRKDAVRIQRLLQGFIIAHDKKIDVTDIAKEDLLVLLNDLGQGVSD